jgi:diketogulonate reductase-like aldo/keto reductase
VEPLRPSAALATGRKIPIGLGTWPLKDTAAENAVANALDCGYRLIDTASRYEMRKPSPAVLQQVVFLERKCS